MLQRMDTLLYKARSQKVALGAFECWDSLNIQGIAMAAKKCNAPVIFQATSMEYSLVGGPEALFDMVSFYVRHYEVEAALHLDHGTNLQEVEECLSAGFTSIMLDASSQEFEKNVELSTEAAKMAHAANAACEAELGHVGGGDSGTASGYTLTEATEVEEFVRRTNVDCLAVAIGTVHGEYCGKPELRLDRLAEIAAITSLPLVLHGGSGTPYNLLLYAIRLGIAKINICTDINKAFIGGLKYAMKEKSPSLAGYFYRPALETMSQKTEELIRLFRGESNR